jgi:dihydrofolate reductase
MIVTLIAAYSENGVLSAGGRLPWHLPDEVRHFRDYCAGKWIMAGRRTWAQMDGWFKPGQTPVVVTRDAALSVPGGYAVCSVEEGLALARRQGTEECVVIGGGQVFAAALTYADRLILTVVHTIVAGDVFFPALPPHTWREVENHHHPADARHAYAFTIRRLVRTSI